MKSNQTLGLLFFIRKERSSLANKAAIYFRITVNHQRLEISLKRSIEISKWVPGIGRAKGTTEEIRQLNEYLNFWENLAIKAHKTLIENQRLVSAGAIKKLILEKPPEQKTFLEVFDYHNAKFAETVGIDRAKKSLVNYETTLKAMKDFFMKTYHINDIELHQLSIKFVADFEHYCRTVRQCGQNTTAKYIKYLGKVVRFAVINQWIDHYPFTGFRASLKHVERGFLTQEELEAIESKVFTIQRITTVRDIFVFCCYTGLSFSDMTRLTSDNIVIGIDGEKWINISRHKTDVKSVIPLLPPAQDILMKFNYDLVTKIKGSLFPTISNQRMNAYLKEIADICGITKKLTFHLARHTFATTVTLTNGVPIESVSRMLGHTSIKTTQIYAKVVEKKLSDDMRSLRETLSLRKNRTESVSNQI